MMPHLRKTHSGRKRTSGRSPLGLEILEDRMMLDAGAAASVINLSGVSVSSSSYDPSSILVQFREVNGHPQAVGLSGVGSVSQALPMVPGLYEIRLDQGVTPQQAVTDYEADPRVITAELNYDLTTSSTVPSVNNPYFSQQWDLSNTGQNGGTPGADIQALQAWSVTTGSPNVTVAVMDTGMDYNNPNLYLNVWINQAEIPSYWYTKTSATSGYDKIVYKSQIKTATPGVITFRDLNSSVNAGLVWKSDGNSYVDAGDLLRPLSQGGWENHITTDGDTAHPDDFFGWNFVANNNNPFDQNGHGTFVAGTIGAVGNSGTGIAGVDWNVQLMPVQFMGATGTGTISNFIEGLNYAVAHGARISNNSWSGADSDSLLLAAIQNAQKHGQIFVAAAGNNGSNNDVSPVYPANFSVNNVVAVAATDNHNQLASFSNYGAKTVALAAPGVSMIGPTLSNSYSTYSGTSMATPLVTGVMALVWGEHPSWSYTQVINQVESTVTKVSGLTGKVSTGGVLNAAAAVGYGASIDSPPQVTSSSASGQAMDTISQIHLSFNEAINPVTLTPAHIQLTGPSGQSITVSQVQAVAGSNNTKFVLSFTTQTQVGNYALKIGSGITGTSGQAILPYSTTFTIKPIVSFRSSAQYTIPASGQVVSTLTVNQNIPISQLTVSLNIKYPQDGALTIYLQAPDGTNILLVNRRGGTGANFTNTTFDDSSATAIRNGTAPFSGRYVPESSLSNLAGKNALGTWKLVVEDPGQGGIGTLASWWMTFVKS